MVLDNPCEEVIHSPRGASTHRLRAAALKEPLFQAGIDRMACILWYI